MSNKIYMVVMNGWTRSYGSTLYLVGVFYVKDWAEKVMETEQLRCPTADFKLIEIEANITYYSSPCPYIYSEGCFQTEIYLGGYVE